MTRLGKVIEPTYQRPNTGSKLSKYKGVYWNRGKYNARVCYNGKQYYAGVFNTEKEAAIAVNDKCRDLGIQASNPEDTKTPKKCVANASDSDSEEESAGAHKQVSVKRYVPLEESKYVAPRPKQRRKKPSRSYKTQNKYKGVRMKTAPDRWEVSRNMIDPVTGQSRKYGGVKPDGAFYHSKTIRGTAEDAARFSDKLYCELIERGYVKYRLKSFNFPPPGPHNEFETMFKYVYYVRDRRCWNGCIKRRDAPAIRVRGDTDLQAAVRLDHSLITQNCPAVANPGVREVLQDKKDPRHQTYLDLIGMSSIPEEPEVFIDYTGDGFDGVIWNMKLGRFVAKLDVIVPVTFSSQKLRRVYYLGLYSEEEEMTAAAAVNWKCKELGIPLKFKNIHTGAPRGRPLYNDKKDSDVQFMMESGPNDLLLGLWKSLEDARPFIYSLTPHNFLYYSAQLKKNYPNHLDEIVGWTNIHLAAARDQPEMLDALLLFKQTSPHKGPSGESPLHLAAIFDSSSSLMWILENKIYPADIKDILGRTAAHYAAFRGHVNALSILRGNGASMHLPDSKGYTPLHIAAQNGHAAAVKYLLRIPSEKKIRTTKRYLGVRRKGKHWEVFRTHKGKHFGGLKTFNSWFSSKTVPTLEEGIRLSDTLMWQLISMGYSDFHPKRFNGIPCIRSQNVNGNTAAHLAAKHGHRDCLKALLVAGSDPSLKNFEELSVIKISSGECIDLLQEYYVFDPKQKRLLEEKKREAKTLV